jgi:predicted AlkP superfamily pyrophosphatase or phosphodiesterase
MDRTRRRRAPRSRAICRLVEGLKAAGLYGRTVLIVVSDHGMAATAADRMIWIDDLVDPAALHIVYNGALLLADPAPGREAEARARLIGPHPHMDCHDKAHLPGRLKYGGHPRVPRIVCLAEVGWLISTRDKPLSGVGGAHGYDNAAPEMQALFIAHGPGVAVGRKVDDLDAVDIHPLVGRLLGIKVPIGDGRPQDSLPIMAPPRRWSGPSGRQRGVDCGSRLKCRRSQ